MLTSKGPGPVPEEYGRVWGKGGKKGRKRAMKVLERWPYIPGPGSKGPQQAKPVMRLKGEMLGKDNKSKGRLERK